MGNKFMNYFWRQDEKTMSVLSLLFSCFQLQSFWFQERNFNYLETFFSIAIRHDITFSQKLWKKSLYFYYYKNKDRTTLVAQWMEKPLLMQGSRDSSLVWEDSTCSVSRAHELQLQRPHAITAEAHAWSLCSATREVAAMRRHIVPQQTVAPTRHN